MDLQNIFDRFNFFYNKYTGSWFTIPELENAIDEGSLALYSDFKPKYATSQLIKDAMIIFRAKYDFTPSTTLSGYIVTPSNTNYLDLLDIQVEVAMSGRTLYAPVKMINEDERANALNSQRNPVTQSNPLGELVAVSPTGQRFFRLYPTAGYTGTVTYFRRPVKPVFAYTVISGRVIVYDQAASTQLEWRDVEINAIIIKALSIVGINLSDMELQQYTQLKSAQNYQGTNII